MSGGGQSISGESKYNWNPYMENMWAGGQDGNGGLLGRAINTLNSPYQRYGGNRLADRTYDQTNTQDALRHVAIAGTPETNAARNTILDTVQGNFLQSNPYNDLRVTPADNQYEGFGEDYQGVKRAAMRDLTDAFNEGTAADTQRMFAQSGAFGGSAHQQAMGKNADALGKNLSRLGQEMDQAQYERSANLRENAINRGMQAQQFDINRLNNNYLTERGFQQGAIPLGLQSEAGRLGALGQLYGIGADEQRFNQMGLDQAYQEWANENNWERNNVNWMANLLAQAQGGIGGQATQTQPGYSINPLSGLLGAASIYGAMR
jgi:hypothetical protein